MADQNDAVFNSVLHSIHEAVDNRYQRSVSQIRKELETLVRNHTRRAYFVMLKRIDIIAVEKEWTPLDPVYDARKWNLRKKELGFYRYKGHLMRELLNRDPSKDWGRPFVSYVEGGGTGGLKPGYRLNAAGRPIHSRNKQAQGMRTRAARKGQFASAREAFRSLQASLRVELFPELDGATIHEAILRMTSDINTLKASMFEFGNRKQPARPLVGPFLEWYAGPALRAKIDQFISQGGK